MTESRAAIATISAQETTPGHTASTFFLILSITLNPLTELLLGPEVFSPVNEDVSSNSIDPSQPCHDRLTSNNPISFGTILENKYTQHAQSLISILVINDVKRIHALISIL